MRPGSLLVPYPPRLQLAAQGLEVPRPFRPVGLRYGEAVDLFFSRELSLARVWGLSFSVRVSQGFRREHASAEIRPHQ